MEWKQSEKEFPKEDGVYLVLFINKHGVISKKIANFSVNLSDIKIRVNKPFSLEEKSVFEKDCGGFWDICIDEYGTDFEYYEVENVKYWMPFPKTPKE